MIRRILERVIQEAEERRGDNARILLAGTISSITAYFFPRHLGLVFAPIGGVIAEIMYHDIISRGGGKWLAFVGSGILFVPVAGAEIVANGVLDWRLLSGAIMIYLGAAVASRMSRRFE